MKIGWKEGLMIGGIAVVSVWTVGTIAAVVKKKMDESATTTG